MRKDLLETVVPVSTTAALARLESILPELHGRLTVQEAAAATGLSLHDTREALARLLELYVTDVRYDDRGTVHFRFAMPLRHWRDRSAVEVLDAALRDFGRVARRLGRRLVGAFVLVYSGLLLIVTLHVMIVLVARHFLHGGTGDRRRLWPTFRDEIDNALRVGPHTELRRRDMLNRLRLRARRSDRLAAEHVARRGDKHLIESVCDFAFGQERPQPSALADQREIASYLTANNGVLGVVDIIKLTGQGYREAERTFIDALGRFGGRAEITEEGIVVGTFEEFLDGTSKRQLDPIVPIWQEHEPPVRHADLVPMHGMLIIAMIGFITMLSVLALTLLTNWYETRWSPSGMAAFRLFLGWLPLAFVVSYVAAAVLRYPGVLAAEHRRRQRAIDRQILRAIVHSGAGGLTLEEIRSDFKRWAVPFAFRDVYASLRRLAGSLDGSVVRTSRDELVARFDRFWRELAVVARVRAEARRSARGR